MRTSANFYKRFSAALCLAASLLLTGCSGDFNSVNRPGGMFSSRSGGGKDPDAHGTSKKSDVDLYNVSAYLSRDPKNARNIRFDNGVVTISGMAGEQGIDSVYVDFPASVDLKRSGSTFTCTVTCKSLRNGFGTIEIVNRKYQNNHIRVRFGKDGISLPDIMQTAKSNSAAAEGEIPENSEVITIMNITAGGDKQRAKEVLNEVRELSDKICRGLTDDYDKLRAISRWVSENIYYDHPAYSAGIPQKCLTLEYILENRAGVCGSYANMTSALCHAQGIICYNVVGEGISDGKCYAEQSTGQPHEWNYALVGGRGVWVDSGWNSTNHLYSGGQRIDDVISCRYFDVGSEILALDHKVKTISNRDFFDPDMILKF